MKNQQRAVITYTFAIYAYMLVAWIQYYFMVIHDKINLYNTIKKIAQAFTLGIKEKSIAVVYLPTITAYIILYIIIR